MEQWMPGSDPSMQPDDTNRSLAELRQELEDTERMFHTLADEVAELERGSAEPDLDDDGPAVELGSFSMILIKHSGSADPTCWRTHRSIDRSIDESRTRLRKLRDKICAPSDFNVKQPAKPKEVRKRFDAAAKLSSDCGETASKSGDLGSIMSGTLAPALDAVARRLAVGAVSEEVATRDGLHILLRQS
eukprot:CAMPEP_0119065324 /NCGR_PEP_ID=MMETSP1178-20130426/8164_1 /TAXON_ID=33656 /ORGANISM="unid sp, Strain CCMP2000" /LENGTH=188 /DNA_ID=CAMNT_0007046829 /DNA_START=74 /DNA_END=640 /DNA_ORIENTATION=-